MTTYPVHIIYCPSAELDCRCAINRVYLQSGRGPKMIHWIGDAPEHDDVIAPVVSGDDFLQDNSCGK